MRKRLVGVLLLSLALGPLGCQKKHPVKVEISPRMQRGEITTIAVFPFTSALFGSEDPEGIAAKTMQKFLLQELDARNEYKFISPNTVSYAAETQGMAERERAFLRKWAKTHQADVGFLSSLAEILKCDGFLVGSVDLWQKDEADFQENATSATYVGATVTILDRGGGVLFEASDENYMEAVRTEAKNRQVVVGASGNVYKDLDRNLYKAPPFEDVALKVAEALAASLPAR